MLFHVNRIGRPGRFLPRSLRPVSGTEGNAPEQAQDEMFPRKYTHPARHKPTDTCGVLWGHRGCGSRVTAPAWLRAALSWDLHLPQELCRPRPRPWPPSLLGRLGRLTARGAARSWGSQRVPDSPGAGARASALHRGRGGSEPSAHSARPDQAGHPR